MIDVIDWDSYFFDIAIAVSKRSRARTDKIGAVIIGPGREIRSTGYNSFPRGVQDHIVERYESPEKYFWFEHAERNAILNAARAAIGTLGCSMYISGNIMPCADCSRAIIQSGIVEIIVPCIAFKNNDKPKWIESWNRSKLMLQEAGVSVRGV